MRNMQVILTSDVKGQGKKGDIIKASDGYARNFLFKNNLAIEASASNVNSIKISREASEHHKQVEKAEAMALAKKIHDTTVTIKIKVGENGKLFGALSSQAIAEALAAQGIDIDKKKIVIPEPIKSLGEYLIQVKPYAEISAKLKVIVDRA